MTTTSPCRLPQPGEVWKLEFAFEDDPTLSKRRPVVVAVVEERAGRAVVVKVAGHGPRKEFSGEMRLADWQGAGLSKPSTVRCSKSLSVGLEAFEGAQYYGRLSRDDEAVVFASLREMGMLA